jgi:hypothetical protein
MPDGLVDAGVGEDDVFVVVVVVEGVVAEDVPLEAPLTVMARARSQEKKRAGTKPTRRSL